MSARPNTDPTRCHIARDTGSPSGRQDPALREKSHTAPLLPSPELSTPQGQSPRHHGILTLRHLKHFAVGLPEPRPRPQHSPMATNGLRTERETRAHQTARQRRRPDGPGPWPSWDQLTCAPSSGHESHRGSDSAMSATPETLSEGRFATKTRKMKR